MTIDWQRILPVIVSILIIIAVAVLRQYSKTFAAIAATMPINMPLAMWIVYSGDNESSREALAQFTQTAMISLPPTFVFIVVAWLAARAGWTLVPMVLTGYAAWGVSLLVMLGLRSVLRF